MLSSILWTIIVILAIIWAIGFFFAHLGGLIHIVIVIAVILLIWNLVTGSMGRRT